MKPNAAFAFILSGLSLWLFMSTDNSEKKQAEEQLRVASQNARSLIEASLDPLVAVSSDGKIINPYLINMLGYSREEFVEKQLWQVGAFEDVEVATVNQSTTASDFAVD